MTLLLIAANVAVFLYELRLAGMNELKAFLLDHSLVAERFFDERGPLQWFTIVSSMFLHGGWMHLIGNMWFLWVFGNNIEDVMGCWRFIFFYLICGEAAAGAQLWIDPHATAPMIGASGAVSGVLGAYLLLFPRARVLTLIPFVFVWMVEVRAWFFLIFWALLQFLNGLPALLFESAGRSGGGVAWWAHIGGFVAGMVLIHIFKKR